MAGYVRQSAADIVSGAVITAAPLNAEFNQLQSAFNALTGHGHSGGAGDGPKLSLTAAVSGVLPIANGGTNATTAAAARTSLGLVIGTNVQAWDTDLDGLAGLTYGADLISYSTGLHAFATTTLTSLARTLIDDTTTATMQTTLGISAFAQTILDDADAAAVRTTIGTVIGTNVQAFDADLSALAANATDGFWAHTGAGTGAARTLTAPAAGFTITNPAGIAGNPTFVLADDLAALEALSTTGMMARTAANTYTMRTITGTANEITLANGDGVAGNPTISLPSSLTFTGKTITGGTYTTPTINNPVLTLVNSNSPTPTSEGLIEWDNDDDAIAIGNGSTTKIFRANDWEKLANTTMAGDASFTATNLGSFRKLRITGYIIPATDGVSLFLQSDANNGASYDVGASDYTYQTMRASGASTLTGLSANNIGIILNPGVTIGNGAIEGIFFTIDIDGFNQSGPMSAVFSSGWSDTAGALVHATGAGTRNDSTARNAIRIIASAGNIVGNITLEGHRG